MLLIRVRSLEKSPLLFITMGNSSLPTRTDCVMHEYKLEDRTLEQKSVFQKSVLQVMNFEQILCFR